MMQTLRVPYQSFLSSDAFHVKGPSGKSFFAHSALLAKRSKVLDKAINGSMKEAEEREISLVDVDGDFDDATVMCFIEFCYTGTYSLPEIKDEVRIDTLKSDCATSADAASKDKPNPSQAKNTTSSTHNIFGSTTTASSNASFQANSTAEAGLSGGRSFGETTQANSTAGTRPFSTFSFAEATQGNRVIFGPASQSASQSAPFARPAQSIFSQAAPATPATQPASARGTAAVKKERLWESFTALAYVVRSEPWEPRLIKSNVESFTADLLCHAQLYVFANRYECSDLTALTLQRLRLTLSRADQTRHPVSVIELIDYTYAYTHDYKFGCDPLRTMVIDYTVCHLEHFASIPKFKDLLRQEGAFADDLLTKTMIRLEA